MKTRKLIGNKVVPGNSPIGAKVFSIGSGVNRFYWRNKTHTVSRSNFSATPSLCQAQGRLIINQASISFDKRFGPKIILFNPTRDLFNPTRDLFNPTRDRKCFVSTASTLAVIPKTTWSGLRPDTPVPSEG
nr:hypothetical protein SYMBAF_40052 [Serratia symbiotica]